MILCCAIGGQAADAPSAPSVQAKRALASEELELLKEEETVSIASRSEQPISQAPSNVYVITDEDLRTSGATDISALLRRIPGMEVMQASGTNFNVSLRGDNQTSDRHQEYSLGEKVGSRVLGWLTLRF